jgi:predicted alpha/beta-hydrolase family hydrolase
METLVLVPKRARALYVLAHGAGAGMRHPFLEEVARLLAERGIGTLRYQFAYLERGGKRVDPPEVAHARVREAVAVAARRKLPLFAGGKSFGGRMTSQAQALAPLPGVRGLIFLGFPLHPPDRPGRERGVHLGEVKIPMLFVGGTRDEFAQLPLLEAQVADLPRAQLVLLDDADHGFHVRRKVTGRSDAEVLASACDAVAAWLHAELG